MASQLRRVAGAAGTSAVIVAVLALVGTAHADPTGNDTPPTRADLMHDCDSAHKCKFIAQSAEEAFTADPEQASPAVFNCLPDQSTYTLDVSDTKETSTTTEADASLSASFLSIYTASISATFSQSWTQSHTWDSSYQVPVDAGWVAWIDYGAPMTKVTGQVNLWYNSKHAGHWNWMMDGVQVVGPNTNGQPNVILKARQMTDAEKSQTCSSASVSARAAALTSSRLVSVARKMSGATRSLTLASADTTGPQAVTGAGKQPQTQAPRRAPRR
jgi:hypothetical protein